MLRIIAGLVIFLSGLLGTSAWATTLARMDLDDLAGHSHAIAHAKIVAKRTQWNAGRTLIPTVYTVEPLEYLKGSLGPVFEIHEPGGELDGLSLTVPGAPNFTVGDETVLFLWTSPQGQHQVIGFQQGAFGVRTDAQSGQKVVDRAVRIGSVQDAQAAASASLTSRSLSQLKQQIRSSAAKMRAADAKQ